MGGIYSATDMDGLPFSAVCGLSPIDDTYFEFDAKLSQMFTKSRTTDIRRDQFTINYNRAYGENWIEFGTPTDQDSLTYV